MSEIRNVSMVGSRGSFQAQSFPFFIVDADGEQVNTLEFVTTSNITEEQVYDALTIPADDGSRGSCRCSKVLTDYVNIYIQKDCKQHSFQEEFEKLVEIVKQK